MTSTGYRRNSLRGGGEREDGGGRLIVETIKGKRGRGGKKGGGGCNAGCWGRGGEKYPHGSAERDLETAEMAASISAFRMLEVLI